MTFVGGLIDLTLFGILQGNGIQVVYAPQVAVIKSNLVEFIESPASDHPDAAMSDFFRKNL